MTGVGRVRANRRDVGAGVAVGPRLVLTANHVVRGVGAESIEFQVAGGPAVAVERVEREETLDAAALHLSGAVDSWLAAGRPIEGAEWRVSSPPPGNDPHLTGAVAGVGVPVESATNHPVRALQLDVTQELGDYRGYSGSGVLDRSGRAVLGILVEQKHLRVRAAPGERTAAANVLFAVSIADVAGRLRLPLRAARPLRFEVPSAPAGVVDRGGLLDRLVLELTFTQISPAPVVRVWGYGGMGKTVVATQAGNDIRVWEAFPGGILLVTAGEGAAAADVLDRLRFQVGESGGSLADSLAGEPALVIVDDVWAAELVYDVAASLPGNVTLAVTTRGVTLQEANLGRKVRSVHVADMAPEEAATVLARGVPRTDEIDDALAELASALGHWALLLDMAAGELHGDELEVDAGDDLEDHSPPASLAPSADLAARARALARAFVADPTDLDDPSSQRRSFDRMVRRSLQRVAADEASRPAEQEHFFQLAAFPPDADLTQGMLSDLWRADDQDVRKRVKVLRRVGLVRIVRSSPVTIRLHDLIVAWLHHERGAPDDVRHHELHRRCVARAMGADGMPLELTADRAEWLAFHLGRTGDVEDPAMLLLPRWRSAYRVATGSDAAYLDALRQIVHHFAKSLVGDEIARRQAWALAAGLTHAFVSAQVAQIPTEALVTQALLGRPDAALRQAATHPDQSQAARSLIEIVAALADDGALTDTTCDLAVRLATGLRGAALRVNVLADMSALLRSTDPDRSEQLAERAVELSRSITDDDAAADALAAAARAVAHRDRSQAITLATAIPSAYERLEALVDLLRGVANQHADEAIDLALALADPGAATSAAMAVIADVATQHADRAVELAGRVPPGMREPVLAALGAGLAKTDPTRAADIALALDDDWPRRNALAAIAPALAEVDHDRAIRLALSLDDVSGRWARVAVAEALASTDPDRAVEYAKSIPTKAASRDALAAVAATVAPADPHRAIAIADEIADESIRNDALVRLVEVLLRTHSDLAVDLAFRVPGRAARSRALAMASAAVQRTTPEQALSLADRAVDLAKAIPHRETRNVALASVADVLVGHCADRALDAAAAIADGEERDAALARMAEALVTSDLDRAVAVADTVHDEGARGRVLSRIALQVRQRVPARAGLLVEQVLELAATLPDDFERIEATATLATALVTIDAERAGAVAGVIGRGPARAVALARLASAARELDERTARTFVDRALAAASTIADAGERSTALARVAATIWDADTETARRLVDEAIDIARAIAGRMEQGALLAHLADIVSVLDIEWALAIALDAPTRATKSRALGWVVPTLARTAPERALDLLAEIPLKAERQNARAAVLTEAIGGIATIAATDPDRAVGLAMRFPNDRRTAALASVARAVAPKDADRALALAQNAAGAHTRTEILTEVAKGLATSDPDQALAVAEQVRKRERRGEALAAIAAAVQERDPVTARTLVERAMALIPQPSGDTLSPAPREVVRALALIDLDRAMDVADRLPGEWDRLHAWTDIAKEVIGREDAQPPMLGGYLAATGRRWESLETALVEVWWSPADSLMFATGFLVALRDQSADVLAVVVRALTDVLLRYSSASGAAHPEVVDVAESGVHRLAGAGRPHKSA